MVVALENSLDFVRYLMQVIHVKTESFLTPLHLSDSFSLASIEKGSTALFRDLLAKKIESFLLVKVTSTHNFRA